MGGILSHIDNIASDITSAAHWEDRDRVVKKKVNIYDTPGARERLEEAATLYPGIPFGILDAVIREGKHLRDPGTQQLIAYAYAREVATGSYDTGKKILAKFATTKLRPGQVNAEHAESQAQSSELNRLGIMDTGGNLYRPTPRQYKDGKFYYNTPQDEATDHKFYETLNDIARQTGIKDIPYTDPTTNEQLIYHTKTGASEVTNQKHHASAMSWSPLGPEFAKLQDNVKDWAENYSVKQPDVLGMESVPQAGGVANPSIKDYARQTGMVLDAPLQEMTGLVRAGYAAANGKGFNPSWQSNYMISLTSPNNISSGKGYFVSPDSEVAARRREREASYGTIDGHSYTLGRIISSALPGSVDAFPAKFISGGIDATAQFLDPTALGLGKAAKISEAKKLFQPEELHEAAGVYKGLRQYVHGPTWEAWSQTGTGRNVKAALANYNPDKEGATTRGLWEAMGRQHDPALIKRLFETRTEQEVDDFMRGVIGTQIRSTHELDKIPGFLSDEALHKMYSNTSGTLRESRLSSRFFDFLPDNSVDVRDRLNVADNLMRWGKLGKVSPAARDEVFDQVASARSKEDYLRAVLNMMGHEDGVLKNAGVQNKASRRLLTRLFDQQYNDSLDALVTDVASDSPIHDLIAVNGENIQGLRPELLLEHINHNIPLPDINRIRRVLRNPVNRWLTTNMSPADIGKSRWPISATMYALEQFWKPLMLVGRFPAWVSRVVGEEQIRMATAGLETSPRHPITSLAALIGRRSLGPSETVAGDPWDTIDELENILVKGNGGSIRRAGGSRALPKVLDKGKAEDYNSFLKAWGGQLAVLNKSPESNKLLNSNVNETMAYLFSDDPYAKQIMERLSAASPEIFGETPDPTMTRNWLENTLADRIGVLTHGHQDLLEATKTGALNGVQMLDKHGNLSKDFLHELEYYFDDYAPRFVKGFQPPSAEDVKMWDRAVDWMFTHTMTRTTNALSRSPAFKQYHWRHVSDMLPFATQEVKEQALANAENAGLSNKLMKALRRAAATPESKASIDDIRTLQHLANGYAADSTKRLLYDLSRRGLFAEQMKLIAPFGNAYQEIFTTYGKLLAGKQYGIVGKFAKPLQVLHRAQQVIEGARANGFFMKNQYNDEVYVFPFSEMVTNAIAGVPTPITGSVQGLNMVGNIFPALGPVAAVPVAAMLDGKPGKWQDIYDFLMPYGAPGERRPDDILNPLSYAPSWMSKAALAMSQGPPPGIDHIPGVAQLWPTKDQAVWDNNAWMSTQVNVMQYLLSTGDYDMSTRAGQNRLLEDAHKKAKDVYWIRAMMQFFAPSAPQFNFVAQDKEGKLISQAAVTEEYYQMLDDGEDLDSATTKIMNKYGTNVFSLVVPKTKGVTYAIPRTREAGDWMKSHRDIVNKYPASYGFFAPQHGKFDYRVVVDQLAAGNTKALDPRTWLNLRNETLKSMQYNFYKDQIGDSPTAEQSTWLRNLRNQLDDDYPSSTVGIPQRPETDEVIAELKDAVNDSDLASNPNIKPLKEYLYYREQAMRSAHNYDPNLAGFQNAKAFRSTREWLAGIAHDLIKDHPDFDNVWTSVLSREFEKDLR